MSSKLEQKQAELIKHALKAFEYQANDKLVEWHERTKQLESELAALQSEPRPKRDPHNDIYGPGDDNYGRDKWTSEPQRGEEEIAEALVREHPDFNAEGLSEYMNGYFNGIVKGVGHSRQYKGKQMDSRKVESMEGTISMIQQIVDDFQELNMYNYDHDQVRALNESMIEIYQIIHASDLPLPEQFAEHPSDEEIERKFPTNIKNISEKFNNRVYPDEPNSVVRVVQRDNSRRQEGAQWARDFKSQSKQ
jgi:hypothetical protein